MGLSYIWILFFATLIFVFLILQQVSGQKSEKHRLIVDHVVPDSPCDLANIREVWINNSLLHDPY